MFKNHIWGRGVDYFEAKRVKLREYDTYYFANVIGSDTYKVKIYKNSKDMTCTCPYAVKGNNCKHMAATLLEIKSKENKKLVTEYSNSLEKLSKKELIQLLVAEFESARLNELLDMMPYKDEYEDEYYEEEYYDEFEEEYYDENDDEFEESILTVLYEKYMAKDYATAISLAKSETDDLLGSVDTISPWNKQLLKSILDFLISNLLQKGYDKEIYEIALKVIPFIGVFNFYEKLFNYFDSEMQLDDNISCIKSLIELGKEHDAILILSILIPKFPNNRKLLMLLNNLESKSLLREKLNIYYEIGDEDSFKELLMDNLDNDSDIDLWFALVDVIDDETEQYNTLKRMLIEVDYCSLEVHKELDLLFEEEYIEEYPLILSELEKLNTNTTKLLDYLFEVEDYEGLIRNIKKVENFTYVEIYFEVLQDLDEEFLAKSYYDKIASLSINARNRSHYNEILRLLNRLSNVSYEKTVSLINNINYLYPTRRVFLELVNDFLSKVRPTLKPINIKEVAEAIDMNSDFNIYYNCSNSTIFYNFEGFEDENEEEYLIMLPSQAETNGFKMMCDFSDLQSESIKKELFNVLNRAKPFRNFQNKCFYLGIREDWFQFKEKKLIEFAKRFCNAYEIPYFEE